MSFTGDNIRNVRSNIFVDLYGGFSPPGTALIICTLNKAPSGTTNQQVYLVSLPCSWQETHSHSLLSVEDQPRPGGEEPVYYSECLHWAICRYRWACRRGLYSFAFLPLSDFSLEQTNNQQSLCYALGD
jgi:hypothetical protein